MEMTKQKCVLGCNSSDKGNGVRMCSHQGSTHIEDKIGCPPSKGTEWPSVSIML